jgi:hypothetical protein
MICEPRRKRAQERKDEDAKETDKEGDCSDQHDFMGKRRADTQRVRRSATIAHIPSVAYDLEPEPLGEAVHGDLVDAGVAGALAAAAILQGYAAGSFTA